MNSFSPASLLTRRSALIVGHPGHELRVWGWMRAARPGVAVLTDGGGHAERSRLHLSADLCREARASTSSHFGMTTDTAMYAAILGGDVDAFLTMSDRLAGWLIDERVDLVAGDAAEGYNPTHDVCRLVVDRAVRLARAHRRVENYAFLLTGSPVPESPDETWTCFELDAEGLAAKIDAGRRYAEAVGGTLLSEIDDLLARFGEAAFAREYFYPAEQREPSADKPFYETYGERQVAHGRYRHVIRFADHVQPIAEALAR